MISPSCLHKAVDNNQEGALSGAAVLFSLDLESKSLLGLSISNPPEEGHNLRIAFFRLSKVALFF